MRFTAKPTEKVFADTEYVLFETLSTTLPVHTWDADQTSTRTVGDLAREVVRGESLLHLDLDKILPSPRRVLSVLGVDVRCEDPDSRQTMRLVESGQLVNGTMRKRETAASISEKLLADEEPDARAVVRALSEELGISGLRPDELVLGDFGCSTEERTSNSYPGLDTVYTLHTTRVDLPSRYYDPAGYTEVQPHIGRTTMFTWVPVEL